ncbi:MAG: M15 family metallopeptidase [Bdellovibrionota bacterium]
MRTSIACFALLVVLGACGEKTSPPEPSDDYTVRPEILLDQNRLNCENVSRLYKSCGAKFSFDGRQFVFDVGGKKKSVACSDGRSLGFFDRVDDMDVTSIFMFRYLEGNSPLPEVRMHHDAGRLRVEELLMNVYGHDESAARTQLVKVKILGQTVPFSKSLGAAKALETIDRELTVLMKTDPAVKKFLEPFTSKKEEIYTFFWRVVSGTNRLSAHSFGVAIDLLTNVGPQYWLWDERADNPERAKQGEQAYRNIHFIPKGAPRWNQKVVDVLERNGFVWGGKWNHYDTMHFEYRPELVTNYKVNCAPLHATRGEPHGERMSDREIDEYLERVAGSHPDHDE